MGYSADPAGCDRTTIEGRVIDANGMALAGVTIRWWSDDPDGAQVLLTDALGGYEIVVADTLTDATYHLQVVEPATGSSLSDVIVAQAIPGCDLNLMTVDFVSQN